MIGVTYHVTVVAEPHADVDVHLGLSVLARVDDDLDGLRDLKAGESRIL